MTLMLTNDDAEALLTMTDCIDALEQAYRDLAHGNSVSAVNSDAITPTSLPEAIYQLKLMGGVIPSLGVAALRLNSDVIAYRNKRQVKLPLAPGERYTGLVILFSVATGEPLAIMPDGVMQRMRVGAASALGARYLARADARSVGLIGAGWQAGAQIMAITATHRIERIRCYSPTPDKREAFCREMSERSGTPVQAMDTPEAAVRGADIVLCATNAFEQVFFERWLEPGMHVGTIRGVELGADVVKRADVYAIHDRSLRGVSAVAKGVTLSENRMAIVGMPDIDRMPTLPELIAGMAPGRTSAQQISCFLNLRGIGLQFAAVGAVLFRKAVAAGRGRELPSDWFTEDVVP
jgi:alanine dehydrogenase